MIVLRAVARQGRIWVGVWDRCWGIFGSNDIKANAFILLSILI